MKRATASFAAAGVAASLLVMAARPAAAVPDWKTQGTTGALTVFADDARPGRFYYAPGEIQVVTTFEGMPDFRFLETRYTGSAVGRDAGMILHKCLVTFRVRLPRVPAEEMARVARELGANGRPADLRPFPIKKIATALVYVSLGGGEPAALPAGRFEAGEDAAGTTGEGYWAERVYTMALDSLTAQAFRTALEKDQVYLSLGYAFLGDARATDAGMGELTGSPEVVAELMKTLASERALPDSAATDSVRTHVIRSGAVRIGLDTKRFPELMRRVDLNDRAPPGYAALNVYCYDFNNELRPDLAEKQVEIDAEGVSGKRVKLATWFKSGERDLYSSSIRFPVAVRLDRPYRYRVREVKQDGMEHAGPWRERASWSQILDVTTPPKEAGVRAVLVPNER